MQEKLFISNGNRKAKIRELSEVYGMTGNIFVNHCIRESDKGKIEEIYIVSIEKECNMRRGDVFNYQTVTDKGFGGSGKVTVKTANVVRRGLVMVTDNIMEVNEEIRLPIWILRYSRR